MSIGSYFDWYEGSVPTQWESRGDGRPFPPRRPAPQSLYSIKGVAHFELTKDLSIGLENEIFYNRVEEYDTFIDDKVVTLNQSAVAWGDVKLKLLTEQKELNFFYGIQFVVPGFYDRPGIDYDGASAVVRPWTGLGAFRLGAEALVKRGIHSWGIESLVALPELERSAIEVGSYELSFTYNLKKKFKSGLTLGSGIWSQYKDFKWRFPENANRKDFAVYPMFSIGWINNQGSREYSLNTGLSVYSWTKDSTVEKPPGSFFVNLYLGFY